MVTSHGNKYPYMLPYTTKKVLDFVLKANIEHKVPRYVSCAEIAQGLGMTPGAVRKQLSILRRRGSIFTAVRSIPALYGVVGVCLPAGVVTPTPVGDCSARQELASLLLALRDSVAGVHDVRLLFHIPREFYYDKLGLVPQAYSKDKRLDVLELGSGRVAKVVAHESGSVSVEVGCSLRPYARRGLGELVLDLEVVRDLVLKVVGDVGVVPAVGDWVVTQWHFARDGGHVAGGRFEVVFRDWQDVFYRVYSKVLDPAAGPVMRVERQESPGVSLEAAAREVLGSS
jgi:hypothetical protein